MAETTDDMILVPREFTAIMEHMMSMDPDDYLAWLQDPANAEVVAARDAYVDRLLGALRGEERDVDA